MLKVDVSSLLNKPQGSLERIFVDEPLNLSEKGDPVIKGNITCDIELLKLPHEINVHMVDFQTEIEARCNRCLKVFIYELIIPEASREFIIDLKKDSMEAFEDVKYVDRKAHAIVLNDMVREEILLHFPPIPLCSQSCKGLCDKCGSDLNEKTCACKHETELKVTPFHIPN